MLIEEVSPGAHSSLDPPDLIRPQALLGSIEASGSPRAHEWAPNVTQELDLGERCPRPVDTSHVSQPRRARLKDVALVVEDLSSQADQTPSTAVDRSRTTHAQRDPGRSLGGGDSKELTDATTRTRANSLRTDIFKRDNLRRLQPGSALSGLEEPARVTRAPIGS